MLLLPAFPPYNCKGMFQTRTRQKHDFCQKPGTLKQPLRIYKEPRSISRLEQILKPGNADASSEEPRKAPNLHGRRIKRPLIGKKRKGKRIQRPIKGRHAAPSRTGLEFVGVHREGGTPGSIPNPEVKPFIADDTAYLMCGNVGRRRH